MSCISTCREYTVLTIFNVLHSRRLNQPEIKRKPKAKEKETKCFTSGVPSVEPRFPAEASRVAVVARRVRGE